MSLPHPIFAQSELSLGRALSAWTNMNQDLRNQLVLLLAFIIVAVGALIWAVAYRKAKHRRVRIRRPHTWQLEPGETKSGRRHRHNERRRRSTHPRPPKNPTLAESGGLPPRRPEDQPPAGA
jgi:hypothetical protein